ncbi:MAG: hypothetical protein MK294_05615, partial [Rhodospirillales bacterium]|nr:hypothetical protein [Rhodospirillales bacterium]
AEFVANSSVAVTVEHHNALVRAPADLDAPLSQRLLKPIFREVLAMSLFVNLLALAVPVFTLQVYDRVIASAGISTLWGLAIGMIFVIIFDYILRMARSRIM